MKYLALFFIAASGWSSIAPAFADPPGKTDSIYLEETVISGNQELPKVLYILPWRDMATELLPERVLNYQSQSLLTPVYPDEQKRQIGFRQTLKQINESLEDDSSF